MLERCQNEAGGLSLSEWVGDGSLEIDRTFITHSIRKTRLRDEVSKVISLERGEAPGDHVLSGGDRVWRPCVR